VRAQSFSVRFASHMPRFIGCGSGAGGTSAMSECDEDRSAAEVVGARAMQDLGAVPRRTCRSGV
jgi:hypothetical protein